MPSDQHVKSFLSELDSNDNRKLPIGHFFSKLSIQELKAFCSLFENMRLPSGQVVKEIGDPEDHLFFVVSGRLKDSIYLTLQNQRTCVEISFVWALGLAWLLFGSCKIFSHPNRVRLFLGSQTRHVVCERFREQGKECAQTQIFAKGWVVITTIPDTDCAGSVNHMQLEGQNGAHLPRGPQDASQPRRIICTY